MKLFSGAQEKKHENINMRPEIEKIIDKWLTADLRWVPNDGGIDYGNAHEDMWILCEEIERLERGEFICSECLLRKNDDYPKAEF